MNEKANCQKCGNVNEVKVSTGHNKPENKGRKYFTCANCAQFQWVEGGNPVHSSGLQVDYSKDPSKRPPTPPTDEEMEMPSDYLKDLKNTKSDANPDWDSIRRQEYRFRGAMELVKNHGLIDLTEEQKTGINKLVEFAMKGV
jgi:hypothetical protein